MTTVNRKIRAAIIGCGKVGHTHAQAYQRVPSSELVAVYDISLERAQDYGKKYGVSGYNNFDKMIAENEIDVISVCTPHPLHVKYIIAAAEHNIHVITEKPLASDLQDCDAAIRACEEHHVHLGVISQRRFYPPVIRMAEAIKKKKIGQPVLANLIVMGWRDQAYYEMDNWRGKWDSEGGGVLVNQTIHQLDLFLWLMGPIQELFGYWDNFNHPYIEVDDTAVAVVRFQSGAIGELLVSNSQKPGFYGKIHIHGSNGASIGAQTEGGSPFVAGLTTKVDPPINDIWTVPGEEEMLEVWQKEDRVFADSIDTMTYYHQLQIEDFIQAILDDRQPLVSGVDARRAVELFTGIYRSQRDNQPIRFPLQPELGRDDFDGRKAYTPYSRRERVAQ